MLPADTKLISVDDHIIEHPHVWLDRLPERTHETAPHVVEVDDGRQAWVYEDQVERLWNDVVTKKPGIAAPRMGFARYDELIPGCYNPVARLEDMDTDGVWAQLAFPQFARFGGQRFVTGKDKDLALLCSKAYNDFVIDEWSAVAPDRLLPMAVLPLWDVPASVAEVERVAAKDIKAIAFSELPAWLGLPSVHTKDWDPLWAAITTADLPVAMHIGSGSKFMNTSDDAPMGVYVALQGTNSMMAFADWLFSGIFERFPTLRIMLSEGGIGWVPYMLETADRSFRYFDDADYPTGTTRLPSETFAEHVYVCFVEDDLGLRWLDELPIDNVMWESDYPHSGSHFPNSRTILATSLADVPDDRAVKIAGGTRGACSSCSARSGQAVPWVIVVRPPSTFSVAPVM